MIISICISLHWDIISFAYGNSVILFVVTVNQNTAYEFQWNYNIVFYTVRSACFHKKRPYCGVIFAMFLCMFANSEKTAVTSTTFGNTRCNVSFRICQVSMLRSLSNLQPDVRDILLTSRWITLLDNNLLKEPLELTDRISEQLR